MEYVVFTCYSYTTVPDISIASKAPIYVELKFPVVAGLFRGCVDRVRFVLTLFIATVMSSLCATQTPQREGPID